LNQYVAHISPGLAYIVLDMLSPPKKNHITCISLLAELAENSAHNTGSKSKSRHYGEYSARSRSRRRYSSDMNGYNAMANSTSTIVGGRSDGLGFGASVDLGDGGELGVIDSKSPPWGFHNSKG